jgi:hypothetical protein
MVKRRPVSPEAIAKHDDDVILAERFDDLFVQAQEAEQALHGAQANGAPKEELYRAAKRLDRALTDVMRAAFAAQRAVIGPRGYDDRIYRRKALATPTVRIWTMEAERLLTLRESHRLTGIPRLPHRPADLPEEPPTPPRGPEEPPTPLRDLPGPVTQGPKAKEPAGKEPTDTDNRPSEVITLREQPPPPVTGVPSLRRRVLGRQDMGSKGDSAWTWLAWVRRILAFALIAGSAVLVLGGNWVNFLRKTEEQVTARGSVVHFHSSFSLSDIAPLLLLAAVLLLPDLEEVPTPWGSIKLLRHQVQEVASDLNVVKRSFDPPPSIPQPTELQPLQVDQLLQALLESPPASHDNEMLHIDPRQFPPANSLLTFEVNEVNERDLGRYFKAIWARLGWMLQLAENIESHNEVWAEDSYPGMKELKERAESWGGAALASALKVWLSTNRALRNQGWYTYNTWSERNGQERRDQLKKAQYLLSRLEADLSRYHVATN